MSVSTLEIALQERFGFNLWQIAAGIAAHGESTLFCVPARSNLGKYAHFLQRVRLTWGRDDVTRPPHYAEGHVYSVNNFAGVNMRDYIRPQCIRSACTIIHIRGGDYLTHMPPALQPEKDFFARALEAVGAEGRREVAVMTDDPQRARELLPGLPIIGTGDEVRDWCILCGARRVICSPSAWCWWAAYAGDHEQVVLADRYGSSPRQAHDLLFPGACYAAK